MILVNDRENIHIRPLIQVALRTDKKNVIETITIRQEYNEVKIISKFQLL